MSNMGKVRARTRQPDEDRMRWPALCVCSSSTRDQRQWRGCRRAPSSLLTLAVEVEAPRGGSARLRLEPRSCHSIPLPVPPYPMKLSAAIGIMTMAMDLERKKGVEIVDERWWIIKDSWVRQQQWLG